jgi:predicted amidohydrolase
MICADREYPETPRMLAEAGAELLLISNACDLTDWHLAMLRTRAFANTVAVAMANYAPPACNGRSPAYGGRGEVLLVGSNTSEEIAMALINLTDLRAYRSSAEAHARRKPMPQLKLCDAQKVKCGGDNNEHGFHRENPISRPAHAM